MPNFIRKFLSSWILHQHFNKTSTPYMKLFFKEYILFSLWKFILLYNISVSRYLQQDNLCLFIFNRFFSILIPITVACGNDDWTCWLDFVQVTTATEFMSTKVRVCSEYSISQHSPFQSSGSYIFSELFLDISEPWMDTWTILNVMYDKNEVFHE